MAIPKTIRVVKLVPHVGFSNNPKIKVGMEGEVFAAKGGCGEPIEYLVKFPRISRWPLYVLGEEVEQVGDRNCEAR